MSYKQLVGSKLQVWNKTAKKTGYGKNALTRKDLMKHKGRIISKKKHAQGKKAIKHLRKLGFIAKKGSFKLFRKSDARKSRRKRKGGSSCKEEEE
jgi:hypothetical protein